MAYEAGSALAQLTGGVLGLALVVAMFVSLFMWPFLVISVVLNIRRIRMQLERLNDTLESRGRSSGGGVLGI